MGKYRQTNRGNYFTFQSCFEGTNERTRESFRRGEEEKKFCRKFSRKKKLLLFVCSKYKYLPRMIIILAGVLLICCYLFWFNILSCSQSWHQINRPIDGFSSKALWQQKKQTREWSLRLPKVSPFSNHYSWFHLVWL